VEEPREVVLALGPVAASLAEALRGRLGDPANTATAVPGGAALPGSVADPDYQRLWQALGHDPTGMDALVSRTGLTAARLSSMLLLMELEGRVVSGHGTYTRMDARMATRTDARKAS
jgi:DNA processing protein